MSDLSSPFTWLNSINFDKNYLMNEPQAEKAYSPFMVNRGLSQFIDTVFEANEMNLLQGLDSKMQYDFLFASVRKKKRFAKWAKKTADEDIDVLMEYYQCNRYRAQEAKRLLTEDQIKAIADFLATGKK